MFVFLTLFQGFFCLSFLAGLLQLLSLTIIYGSAQVSLNPIGFWCQASADCKKKECHLDRVSVF
ncbi:hypothetical protein LZ24_01734 [Desulfobotulus alkaliphilus]|uniref:Uncharacterized protein n=1 Tax=Desulfobotulus alkaliphilus TaxID=622671 RepID=A0A562RRN8_9BACT|nr:hypothetical protein LZ24_01734 [Desulfobotulus alkaliphilus]